eukprot:TRINITY_DN7403_c0_g1_i2.p1 TRINITY_DN7403_c0_g1~~TRINITY_DN7403_c0_g1_i2.p1  ORF type:complete len:518 (+),score=85.48 TRINITY_DN7403_c0_g1_i2:69-1556(+)
MSAMLRRGTGCVRIAGARFFGADASIKQIDSAWLQQLAARGGVDAASQLQALATSSGKTLNSRELASQLDAELGKLPSSQRGEFRVPTNKGLTATVPELAAPDAECTYMVGNSLGLQPRRTRQLVCEELDSWEQFGVNGHMEGRRPWLPIDENVIDQSAAVVGAKTSEVAIMNSLTVNLHLLLISFYRPQGKRIRIMYEADAFASDYFAFESQARLHGLDPKEVLLPLRARPGEDSLRTEDILEAIREAGDSLATVCLGTVQYYTGQLFNVPEITAAAQKVGAKALWDCAHAAGNIDMKLHEWGVDGACWCSYKYLNAGPGGIAGFFVHERHHGKDLPLLAGWWGQRKSTRFNMEHKWEAEVGASAWRLSNPPVLQTVSLLASLDVFAKTSMTELRGRSMLLTGYLELLLQRHFKGGVSCITPADPSQRGCQLSLKFESEQACKGTFQGLEKRGVVVDYRKPNVIRVAPAPLYNTFSDVHRFSEAFSEALSDSQA